MPRTTETFTEYKFVTYCNLHALHSWKFLETFVNINLILFLILEIYNIHLLACDSVKQSKFK